MTFERYDKRILKAQLFIEENLDEDLKLEAVAQVAGISPFHFHRIFKGISGETLAAYVRRVRLEQAAILLKHTERSVTDIAFGAGYQTHESFTRAFQRRFGISPSQMREGVIPKSNYQREHINMSMTTYEVKITDLEPKTVAARRHVGPYESAGPVFDAFIGWAGQNGLLGPQTQILGMCHDDPNVTESSKIRFDCCVTVDDSFEPTGDVLKQTVAGGRYAVLCHRGPYTQLSATYDWFFAVWLKDSGEALRDIPPFEVYASDPQSTPPEDLQTYIHLPLV